MELIRKGKYQHYKNGQFYEVLGISYNADNNVEGDPLTKPYVLYRPLYNDSTWVRPLHQFDEDIELDGKIVKRFAFVE